MNYIKVAFFFYTFLFSSWTYDCESISFKLALRGSITRVKRDISAAILPRSISVVADPNNAEKHGPLQVNLLT